MYKDGLIAVARGRRLGAFVLVLAACSLVVVVCNMMFSLSTVALQISSLVLPTLAGFYHGYHSPYSFNINDAHHPAWMASLPDSTSLTTLSIPGTHDTMTSSASLGSIYQCQSHVLGAQLEAGIRYIDIRATNINDELLVYHGPEYTGFTYADVLHTLFSFLEENPSETILMRFKEESAAINSTMTFEEVFNKYRLSDPDTAPGCMKHFWIPPAPGPTAIPTLGELRGHVLIIQKFGPDPAPYGVKYESPLFVIEDDYELRDLGDMDTKFSVIVDNMLGAANSSERNGGKGDGLVYLTHLSASVGVLPIEVAAGPYNRTVVGQNDRAGNWLSKHVNRNGTTGVVIIDFPGECLIEQVLARN